jgi:hypothetical protein
MNRICVFLRSSERRCSPFAFVALAKDIEVAKAVDFIVYHAFIGFWNRECGSMERLGIGFDFDMDRFGGYKWEDAFEKESMFVE